MKPWAESFYASKLWEETRTAYLAHVHGLCERCLKDGAAVPAKIVHHKVYLTPRNINDPNITLCFDNLEALCQDCHNREHHRKERVRRYRVDAAGRVIPPIQKTS